MRPEGRAGGDEALAGLEILPPSEHTSWQNCLFNFHKACKRQPLTETRKASTLIDLARDLSSFDTRQLSHYRLLQETKSNTHRWQRIICYKDRFHRREPRARCAVSAAKEIVQDAVTDSGQISSLAGLKPQISVFGHQFIETTKARKEIAGRPAPVTHVLNIVPRSPLAPFFVTAGADGFVKIWDAHTARLAFSLRRHFSAVTSLLFLSSRNILVSADGIGHVRFWKVDCDSWKPLGYVETCSGSSEASGSDGVLSLTAADRGEKSEALVLAVTGRGSVSVVDVDKIEASARPVSEGGWGAPAGSLCEAAEILRTECRMDDRYIVKGVAVHADESEARVTLSKTRNLAVQDTRVPPASRSRRGRPPSSNFTEETESESLRRGMRRIPPIWARGVEMTNPDLEYIGAKTRGKPRLTTNLSLQSYTWPDDLSAVTLVIKLDCGEYPEGHGFRVLSDFNPSSAPLFVALPRETGALTKQSQAGQAVLCIFDDGRLSRWEVDAACGRFQFGAEFQSPMRSVLPSPQRPATTASSKRSAALPKPRSPSPCTFLSPDIVRSLGSKVINKDLDTSHQPIVRSPGVVFVHPISLGIQKGTVWIGESCTSDGRRPKDVLRCSMKETGIALLNYETGQLLGKALYGRHLKSAIVFLSPHPHLPSVCLLASYGGHLMVVDIIEGCIIYLHVSEGTTFLAGAWHNDGREFVVTNANGCFTVFNCFTGDPSRSRLTTVTINGNLTETSYVFPDSSRFRYTPLIQFLSCDRNPLVEASLRSIFAPDEPMSPQLQLAVSLVEDLTGLRRFSGWLFDIHFARMPHLIKLEAKLVDHMNENLLPRGTLLPSELHATMLAGSAASENTIEQFKILKQIIHEQRLESDKFLVSSDGCTLRICCPIAKYQPATYPDFISGRHGGPGITFPNSERLILDAAEPDAPATTAQSVPLSNVDSAEEPDWEQEDDEEDSEEDSLEDDPTLPPPPSLSVPPRRRPAVSSPSMSDEEEDEQSSVDSLDSEAPSLTEIRSGADILRTVTEELTEHSQMDFSSTPFRMLTKNARTDLVHETIQTILLRYYFLLTLANPKKTGFTNEAILDLLPDWIFSSGDTVESIAEHLHEELDRSGHLPSEDAIGVTEIANVLLALQTGEASVNLSSSVSIPKTALCVLCNQPSQVNLSIRRENEALSRDLSRHMETYMAQWQNRSEVLRLASVKAAALSSRRRLRSSQPAGTLAEVPLFLQLVERLAIVTQNTPYIFELTSPATLLGPLGLKDGDDDERFYIHRGCLRSLIPRQPSPFRSGPPRVVLSSDIRSLVQLRQSNARRRRRASTEAPIVFFRCVACEQQGAHLQCLFCGEPYHHFCALKRASVQPPMDVIPPAYMLSPRAFIAETGAIICTDCVKAHFWPLLTRGGNLQDSSAPPTIDQDFFTPQVGDAVTLLDPGPQRAIKSASFSGFPANALVLGRCAGFSAYSFRSDAAVTLALTQLDLPDFQVDENALAEGVTDRQRLMQALSIGQAAVLFKAVVEMNYLVVLLPPHRRAGQLVLLNSSELSVAPIVISLLSTPMPSCRTRRETAAVVRHRSALDLPRDFALLGPEEQRAEILAAFGADVPEDTPSSEWNAETYTARGYPGLADLNAQLSLHIAFLIRQAAGRADHLVAIAPEASASTTPTCLSGAMSPIDQLIGIRLIGQALVCPSDWPEIVKRLQRELKESNHVTELDFWQMQQDPSSLTPMIHNILAELQTGSTKYGIFQEAARLPEVNVMKRLPANPRYTTTETALAPLRSETTLHEWEPAYAVEIPVPVSLETIFRRLWTGFYRSFDAFANDLELLVLNSISFNGPEHALTQDAILLRDSVLEGFKSCDDLHSAHRCPFPHRTRLLSQSCRNPQVLASLFLESLIQSRGLLTRSEVAHLREQTLKVIDKRAELTSGQEEGPLPGRRARRSHNAARRRPESSSSESERLLPKKRRRSARLVS